MRDYIIFAFIFGTIPIILWRPHIGIFVWTVIALLNPHRLAWNNLDFSSLRLAMVIGGVTIAAWLFSRESHKLSLNKINILLVLFGTWVSITTYFALDPEISYIKWERSAKMLIMIFLMSLVISSRERIHAFVWLVVVCIGYFGIKGGLFTILGGAQFRVWGPPGSFISGNNSLALGLIMVCPLFVYLHDHSANRWVRVALYAALLSTAIATIGTQSRGALVAGLAMLLMMVLKSRQRGAVVLLVLVTVVFGIGYTSTAWIERMGSIVNYESDASVQGRFDAWNFAYRLALDRPILGGGFLINRDEGLFLSYVPEAAKSRSFHSIFFEVLGEHGFVGLLLFAGLLAAAFLTGNRVIRLVRRHREARPDLLWMIDLAKMCQVSLVGYGVGGLFQNASFFDLSLIVMMLISTTYELLKKEIAAVEKGRDRIEANIWLAGGESPLEGDRPLGRKQR